MEHQAVQTEACRTERHNQEEGIRTAYQDSHTERQGSRMAYQGIRLEEGSLGNLGACHAGCQGEDDPPHHSEMELAVQKDALSVAGGHPFDLFCHSARLDRGRGRDRLSGHPCRDPCLVYHPCPSTPR